MNKLYTLLLIIFLAGCSPQYNSFHSASNSFTMACKYSTIDTNLTSTGTMMTITATCTKAK